MGAYLPVTPSSANEIRDYHAAGIEASMQAVLSNLKSGKSGAVVVYQDVDGDIRGAVYGRRPGRFFGILPPGEWSYVGTLGWSPKGHLVGGAGVAYSW